MPKPLMVIAKYQGADGAKDNQIFDVVGREPDQAKGELEDYVFPSGGDGVQRTRVLSWIPKDAKEQNAMVKSLGKINGVDVSTGTEV